MAIPGHQPKTIQIAAMDGDCAAIQRWLDAGLFVDKRDLAKRTGLHQAAWSGRIEELISFKADIDAKDSSLETPLSKAAWAGNVEAVEILLEAGANVDTRDTDGHLAGNCFSRKVPPETRETIVNMMRERRRELVDAKESEEEIRRADIAKTRTQGRTRNHCGCCVS